MEPAAQLASHPHSMMPGSLRARRDRLHGVGYASPSNIAVWVRPRMGLHEGWIISCGMARRNGRDIPPPIRAFLFATRKDSHNLQYVQPMQRLFLARLNMHLSFKIIRVCMSEGAMPPSWADQLSSRTFCQLGPLVPACSHGRIAEHMSGGSCVPRCSDFRPAPPSCVPCFPGPFPQSAGVQGLDFRALPAV